MPTYAYACTTCDHRFEAQQSFSDDALTECPECTGRVRKLFNSVGIVFKGSGFYRTDSRTSPSSSDSGSSDSSGKSESGKSESGKSDSGKSESTTNGSSSNGSGTNGSSGKSDSSKAATSPKNGAKTSAGSAA